MSLKSLVLSTSLVALATAAQAADPQTGYDWTGGYVGASAGISQHQARWEDPNYFWYGSSRENINIGGAFGAQAGYNWQRGALVYGVEADIMGLTSSRTTQNFDDLTVKDEASWMATFRGRAGIGIDETFIYFTGGVALGGFDHKWLEASEPDEAFDSYNSTSFGVVGGFGIERAVASNWTIRAEALLAQFNRDSDSYDDGGAIYEMKVQDTVGLLRFGVNYRFGDPGSAGQGGAPEGTPFDFSGFYLGGSAGGHTALISATDPDYEWYGSTYQHRSDGASGGIHAGYNWQNGATLIGLEAEFAVHGGSEDYLALFDNTAPIGGQDVSTSLNWSGALKLKSGIVAQNTLMYVLGGLAIADYDNTFAGISNGVVRSDFDVSSTELGLIVGAGVEQAITPNLSVRLEATYTAFDGKSDQDADGDEYFLYGFAEDVAVRAGISYYFGDRGEMGSGVEAPLADWSGAFAGVDAIAAHHTSSIYDQYFAEDGGTTLLPSFGAGAGVNVGYNWQNGSFVAGVIADIAAYSNDASLHAEDYRDFSSSLNWMGSVRARAGVASGNTHFFATAGLAFADMENNVDEDENNVSRDNDYNFDGTRVGWTAGLGVEHRVTDQGSIKFEALYTGFGEADDAAGTSCRVQGNSNQPCDARGNDHNMTFKLGYTHKFGG